MININWNFKDWGEGLIGAEATFSNASEDAMIHVMQDFLRDVLDDYPSCPVKTGKLYAGHRLSYRFSKNLKVGILRVVDVPYAWYVHEGIAGKGFAQNYTRPGSGANWIGSKIERYKYKYQNAMIRTIAKHMEGRPVGKVGRFMGTVKGAIGKVGGFFGGLFK